ncbi:50S ribosomal protein L17 [bacterium]|nr:50S ribosomal protein L17 [bacterium]
MRHRKKSLRLGVKTDHRLAMMRNLTMSLVEHGRIKTTVSRAKRLRPFVEKLVTRLKDPSLANLRIANAKLSNRDVALKIANEISPKFSDRPGGYTRIMRLATPRAGDAADMAFIEWTEESLVAAYSGMVAAPKKPAKKGAKKTAKKAGKKAAPKKAAESKSAEPKSVESKATEVKKTAKTAAPKKAASKAVKKTTKKAAK